ncbi:hypothetical protein K525DRAFT_193609, partial [Schizophyllum commune Loenen D]
QSHRFYLEDGNLRFQLEDGTLFNVHRYFFKKHAPSFAVEYLQDVAEEPIRLPGITTIDFERFLTMIYPSEIGERDIETVDEWTSVLRLATKWAVPRLRTLAICEIEPKATPIKKVDTAREFDLGKDWLLPSFTTICTSSKPLYYEEAERLGLRTVVNIARIREARCRASDREPKERDFDVASSVLASSVLVPAQVVDVSPSGDHDPVIDDLSPTPLSESSTTDIPSSPAVERASSNLSNDISAIQIGVTDISNRLAHFALQYSEMAEAANVRGYYYPTTYALELAHRIETETSPAAKLQLEWRRKRVEKFIHDTFYCHSDAANDLDASVFIWKGTIGSYLGDPLAMIAARQLVRRGHCACGTFDAELGHSTQRSTLVIRNLRQAPVKKLVESELKK